MSRPPKVLWNPAQHGIDDWSKDLSQCEQSAESSVPNGGRCQAIALIKRDSEPKSFQGGSLVDITGSDAFHLKHALGHHVSKQRRAATDGPRNLGLHCLDHEVGGVRRASNLQVGFHDPAEPSAQSLPRCEEDNQRRRDHPSLKGPILWICRLPLDLCKSIHLQSAFSRRICNRTPRRLAIIVDFFQRRPLGAKASEKA